MSNRETENSKSSEFIKSIIQFVIVVVLALFIKSYVISPVKVSGDSMLPTLHDKDLMILDRISHHFDDYDRFDIVVLEESNMLLIKRIIGLPGDYVEYKGNQLHVNGEVITEEFIDNKDKEFYTTDFTLEDLYNVEAIPNGMYLVLGDNRQNSRDSRAFGLVSESDILGKTKVIIYPFNHFDIVY